MAYIIGLADDPEIKALELAGFDTHILTPTQRGYLNGFSGGDESPEPDEEGEGRFVCIYVDCDMTKLVDLTPSPSGVWHALGDVPVDDDDCIKEQFLHFPVGTRREIISIWFEKSSDAVVSDAIKKFYPPS